MYSFLKIVEYETKIYQKIKTIILINIACNFKHMS